MSWRLYVDIGNSAIKFGVPGEDGWERVERHPHEEFLSALEMPDETLSEEAFAKQILNDTADAIISVIESLWAGRDQPEALVLVCSDPQTDGLIQHLAARLKMPVRRLGKDFKHKIRSRYNLVQLGQDRLANIVAALAHYEPPLVIVDAGSCVTVDALDANGLHIGGMIVPGQPALVEGMVAVVPHLLDAMRKPKLPQGLIGTSTAEAISAGLVVALLGPVVYALEAIEDRLDCDEITVLLCGGFAEPLDTVGGAVVDEWLTLTGLRLADEAAYPPP